ncbi:hypothetical protein ACFV3R_20670 [Streptomyces sp. NPDC059740]|uniref:hypothetical protein n=1 Tax=Streptomyces sp. NPDC059740 TaxID=3346926 RepID=UPI0036614DA6
MPPQQPPYGWVPPGHLPRKSGKAKALGIVGAVVGLVVVGSVIGAVRSGGQNGSGGRGSSADSLDAGPRYKISVPKTLLDGQYTLSQDVSKQADAQVPNEGSYSHDLKTVGGQYTGGMKSIVLLGMYGIIDDPQQSVDSTIHGMTTGGKATVAVPQKKYTPNGADSLTCGVMETSQAGQKVPVPYCVWADHSTSGNVVRSDAADIGKDPESIDVAAFAQEAAEIRDEVRKPIG